MGQFQTNRFYFGNAVVFTLLVLLSLGAQAKPSDNEVVVQSISQEEQNAALEYWTPERMAATQAMQAQAIKMINDDPGNISESKHISTPAGTEILTAGLLFFRVNGEDSSCTANVVQAATKVLLLLQVIVSNHLQMNLMNVLTILFSCLITITGAGMGDSL